MREAATRIAAKDLLLAEVVELSEVQDRTSIARIEFEGFPKVASGSLRAVELPQGGPAIDKRVCVFPPESDGSRQVVSRFLQTIFSQMERPVVVVDAGRTRAYLEGTAVHRNRVWLLDSDEDRSSTAGASTA